MRAHTRVTALITVLASTSTFVACSLLVDTSGLVTPPPTPGTPSDAQSDVVSTSTSQDGETDATASSSQDGDATNGPFCANNPGHTACFDFDDTASLPASLSKVVTPPATTNVDSSNFQSAPRALHCTVPTANDAQGTVRYDEVPAVVATITVSFSMYVVRAPIELATLTNINLRLDPDTFWQVGLGASTGGAKFNLLEYGVESGVTRVSESPPVTPQVVGKWLRIRLSLQLGQVGATPPKADMDIDGTKLTKPITPPSWMATAPQRRIIFGVSYIDSQPDAELYIDDIIIDIQ